MVHRFVIFVLILTGISLTVYLGLTGYDYYVTSLVERPHHPEHSSLKASGLVGHGLGIFGSMCLLTLFLYSARKRFRFMAEWGNIRHWLNIHIFLGIMGPILITFHSTFKFGGLISIAYWSMMAVMLSGFIGRFLYSQIPRSRRGTELSLQDMDEENEALAKEIRAYPGVTESFMQQLNELSGYHQVDSHSNAITTLFFVMKLSITGRWKMHQLKQTLQNQTDIPSAQIDRIFQSARRKALIQRKIIHLNQMQKLFHLWHVVHKPFAYTMVVIMFIHIIVTVLFGARWVF